MPAPRHGDRARFLQDHVEHGDEHVLADIGIELAVHFPQYLRGRQIARRLAAQYAAAHRHNERGGNALAADIGDRQPPVMRIDLDEVEVIAADFLRRGCSGRQKQLKPSTCRRAARQENALLISRATSMSWRSSRFFSVNWR